MKTTRNELHRVATHIVARARFAVTGKFGLRATPGGFGTPAFGDAIEVIRVTDARLVREQNSTASSIGLHGSTLDDLAAFTGVDLDVEFAAGSDTPLVGDRRAPLSIDGADASAFAAWWDLGWRVLDTLIADERGAPAIQLWPEHFDAGTSVRVGDDGGARCNLGASPGDAYSDEPYLYVGPWRDERPGDATYWNAPFGAVMRRRDVLAAADPFGVGVAFMRHGVDLLKSRG